MTGMYVHIPSCARFRRYICLSGSLIYAIVVARSAVSEYEIGRILVLHQPQKQQHCVITIVYYFCACCSYKLVLERHAYIMHVCDANAVSILLRRKMTHRYSVKVDGLVPHQSLSYIF